MPPRTHSAEIGGSWPPGELEPERVGVFQSVSKLVLWNLESVLVSVVSFLVLVGFHLVTGFLTEAFAYLNLLNHIV